MPFATTTPATFSSCCMMPARMYRTARTIGTVQLRQLQTRSTSQQHRVHQQLYEHMCPARLHMLLPSACNSNESTVGHQTTKCCGISSGIPHKRRSTACTAQHSDTSKCHSLGHCQQLQPRVAVPTFFLDAARQNRTHTKHFCKSTAQHQKGGCNT